MKSTQPELRDALKVALQDAKALFDDGLLDEQEYVDLKQLELRKYKDALASLSTGEQPGFTTPPRATQSTGEPLPDPGPEEESTPPDQRVQSNLEEAIDVDPDVYERLRTPPIFRRRSATARRTVVLSRNDLDVLQSHD
jgi:hypothetical protein